MSPRRILGTGDYAGASDCPVCKGQGVITEETSAAVRADGLLPGDGCPHCGGRGVCDVVDASTMTQDMRDTADEMVDGLAIYLEDDCE